MKIIIAMAIMLGVTFFGAVVSIELSQFCRKHNFAVEIFWILIAFILTKWYMG